MEELQPPKYRVMMQDKNKTNELGRFSSIIIGSGWSKVGRYGEFILVKLKQSAPAGSILFLNENKQQEERRKES